MGFQRYKRDELLSKIVLWLGADEIKFPTYIKPSNVVGILSDYPIKMKSIEPFVNFLFQSGKWKIF